MKIVSTPLTYLHAESGNDAMKVIDTYSYTPLVTLIF